MGVKIQTALDPLLPLHLEAHHYHMTQFESYHRCRHPHLFRLLNQGNPWSDHVTQASLPLQSLLCMRQPDAAQPNRLKIINGPTITASSSNYINEFIRIRVSSNNSPSRF